jgi:hypothetical protein
VSTLAGTHPRSGITRPGRQAARRGGGRPANRGSASVLLENASAEEMAAATAVPGGPLGLEFQRAKRAPFSSRAKAFCPPRRAAASMTLITVPRSRARQRRRPPGHPGAEPIVWSDGRRLPPCQSSRQAAGNGRSRRRVLAQPALTSPTDRAGEPDLSPDPPIRGRANRWGRVNGWIELDNGESGEGWLQPQVIESADALRKTGRAP